MIEIADRVHLLDAQSSKNAIMEDAYDQWKRMAAFEWRETYEKESQRYTPPASAAWYDIVGSMEFVADQSSNPFSSLDQDLGAPVDETLYDFVWETPVAEYRQEGITKGLLHDHRRRASYVLSWPNNCTFVTNNSLPAIIEAYEAQTDRYRQYQITGGAWEHFFVAGSSTPHVVSIQAYDMGSRLMNIDTDTDYTITDLHTAFSQQPQLGREPGSIDFEATGDWLRDPSFARIGKWECNCAPATSHRQIVLSIGDRRPLNLLI